MCSRPAINRLLMTCSSDNRSAALVRCCTRPSEASSRPTVVDGLEGVAAHLASVVLA